ncbi:MAG: hypothetical protein M1522_08300 [Actinobacteria bacterium]|nr:hypothetical protein [Actinomycetota bacterium]
MTADTLMIEAELARSSAIATAWEAARAGRVYQASRRAAYAVAQARSAAWVVHAPSTTADELEAAFQGAVRALAVTHDAAIDAAIECERARLAWVEASITALEAGWADDTSSGTVQVGPTERIER